MDQLVSVGAAWLISVGCYQIETLSTHFSAMTDHATLYPSYADKLSPSANRREEFSKSRKGVYCFPKTGCTVLGFDTRCWLFQAPNYSNRLLHRFAVDNLLLTTGLLFNS